MHNRQMYAAVGRTVMKAKILSRLGAIGFNTGKLIFFFFWPEETRGTNESFINVFSTQRERGRPIRRNKRKFMNRRRNLSTF